MPAPWVPQGGGGGDGKVLIDSSDTTADFLAPKLAAGTGVTLTVLNPGGDEQLEIAAPLVDTNMVLVDIIDTVPGFLADKIEGSDTITIDIVGSPSERMVFNAVIPASVPLFATYIVNPNFGAVAPNGSDEAPFELVSDAIAQAVSNGLSDLVILFYGVPAGTESITVPDNFTLTIDCPGYAGAPFSGIVLGDGCVVTLLNARCTGVTPRVTVASPGNSGTLIWTNIDTENAGTTTDQVVGIDAPDYDLQLTNVGLLGNSTAHNVSMVGCGPHRFSGVGSLTCARLQATDTLFYSGFGLAISGRAIFTNCDVSGSGPVITNPGAPIEVDSYTAKRFFDAGVAPSGGINVIELIPAGPITILSGSVNVVSAGSVDITFAVPLGYIPTAIIYPDTTNGGETWSWGSDIGGFTFNWYFFDDGGPKALHINSNAASDRIINYSINGIPFP